MSNLKLFGHQYELLRRMRSAGLADNKSGILDSHRVRVFQLTGNIHDFDSDQFFTFIIKDDQIVDVALAVGGMRFLFEPDVERVHIILIVQPQFTRGKADAPVCRLQQFFFAGNDYSSWFSLRHTIFALFILSATRAEIMNPSRRLFST